MRCLKARWSARQDLNLRLPHCKCGTHTAELRDIIIACSPLNISAVPPHVAKLHCTLKHVVNGLVGSRVTPRALVEKVGLEPTRVSLQKRCSPN